MPKTKPIPTLTPEQVEHFWSKVDRRGIDECWEWTACCNEGGYGSVNLFPYGSFLTNRVAYFRQYGRQPGDLNVLHTCDNPPCCNPEHLWLGTIQDNNADRVRKGRTARQVGEANGEAVLTEDQVHEILCSFQPLAELAKQYQVGLTTISRVQRGLNWNHFSPAIARREDRRQGERHPRTFLSEDQVVSILLSNEPQTVLAERYGTLPTTINNIQRRYTWRHVRPDLPPKNIVLKLSNEDVSRIRESDEPSAVLATRLGVNRSTVTRIRAGKTRTHLRKEY